MKIFKLKRISKNVFVKVNNFLRKNVNGSMNLNNKENKIKFYKIKFKNFSLTKLKELLVLLKKMINS